VTSLGMRVIVAPAEVAPVSIVHPACSSRRSRIEAVVQKWKPVIGALAGPLIGTQGSLVNTLPGEPDLPASFYDDRKSCSFECDTAAREAERSTEAYRDQSDGRSLLATAPSIRFRTTVTLMATFRAPATRGRANIALAVALLMLFHVGGFAFICAAIGQPAAVAKSQSNTITTYEDAVSRFRSILSERRSQINSNQRLPYLPGQALYRARNNMISAYKDLTDALPAKIGKPNKFGIPPAYFDADNESLLDEYRNLFNILQAPPANAQGSSTPFNDVVNLGTAIGRAKGLDAANAEVAGRISLGLFFAETNGKQNIGSARSNTYKGSLQTGASEDRNGQRKWAAIKESISAFDPALGARDAREEERIGTLDHRLNHWTAIRDGLMNAHAELFMQIPAIARVLPDPIAQMKLFELIQIIPSPIKSALRSSGLLDYRVSEPIVMRYLRNNNIFTFGHVDRSRTSATMREILDAMWLFNGVFERALAKFSEIKAR
jgi:hypothetical protein